MPATTTPNGYPYPISTEPVQDGAAAIQSLAEKVDDQVGLLKCGTQASGTLTAGVTKTIAITFTTPFPASGPVPNVVVSLSQTTLATAVAWPGTITRSGFNLNYQRATGTASMDADWHASNVGNW